MIEKNPVQEALNTILDLERCNSTHCKSCPRYHNRSQPLPDCDCFFAKRLSDACEELNSVQKLVSGLREVL